MADPLTLTAIGIAGSAAGGVLGAIGAKQQAGAQADVYSYQAGMARLNAQIARQNQNYATTTGELQAAESGMATRAQIGTTRARLGASGLAVNTGSAADVITSEGMIGDINQAVIRQNAARVAYGYKVEEAQDITQAGLYDASAKNVKTAGNINAMASLISGATGVSTKWLQAKQTGVFGGSGSGSQAIFNPDSSTQYLGA